MSTRADLEAELVTVKANIAAMLADPRPNYRVGETTMNYGDLLDSLTKYRWELETKIGSIPTEAWDSVDVSTDCFGQDTAEYSDS